MEVLFYKLSRNDALQKLNLGGFVEHQNPRLLPLIGPVPACLSVPALALPLACALNRHI